MNKIISLIAAIDENGGLGYKNELLWHLPNDFKWFKKNSVGKTVIMGRNTMNSIGRALPNRQNIVISKNSENLIDNFMHSYSINEAIKNSNSDEIMIIGGGQIYFQTIDMADKLYLTKVCHAFEKVDVFFPKIAENKWSLVFSEKNKKDEKHLYDYEFLIYEKKL